MLKCFIYIHVFLSGILSSNCSKLHHRRRRYERNTSSRPLLRNCPVLTYDFTVLARKPAKFEKIFQTYTRANIFLRTRTRIQRKCEVSLTAPLYDVFKLHSDTEQAAAYIGK